MIAVTPCLSTSPGHVEHQIGCVSVTTNGWTPRRTAGALDALRGAGKARPNQFLGGIDGERDAVVELRKTGSPFKASISLASPIFGYAMGRFAADWLEGKSVPQGIDILPKTLTIANIAQYERDVAQPGAVYNDLRRRNSYLRMYGNICFDSRYNYMNFPWSSERRR